MNNKPEKNQEAIGTPLTQDQIENVTGGAPTVSGDEMLISCPKCFTKNYDIVYGRCSKCGFAAHIKEVSEAEKPTLTTEPVSPLLIPAKGKRP